MPTRTGPEAVTVGRGKEVLLVVLYGLLGALPKSEMDQGGESHRG